MNKNIIVSILLILIPISSKANSLLDSIIIGEYNDVKDEIQSKILDVERINFKKKNNMQIFQEMTRDEWIESAFTESDSTDIQIIIDKILEE